MSQIQLVMLRGVGAGPVEAVKISDTFPKVRRSVATIIPRSNSLPGAAAAVGDPLNVVKISGVDQNRGLSGSRNLLHRFWCPDFGKALEFLRDEARYSYHPGLFRIYSRSGRAFATTPQSPLSTIPAACR
jgi:hypothetical protein